MATWANVTQQPDCTPPTVTRACSCLSRSDSDGRLCVFAESYAVYTMEDDHISQVLELGYPEPEYAVVDKSAASLKGHLHHTRAFCHG
jgi:hypothetical protein